MDNKYIVFGAGSMAENACSVIENIGEILAFVDNDSRKWGSSVKNYKVIAPSEIAKFKFDYILICSKFCAEIQLQLLEMGINKIRVLVGGCLLYEYGIDNKLEPISILNPTHDLSPQNKLSILFTQIHPCGRTNKLAEILYNNGIEVSLAYMHNFPDSMKAYLKYYSDVKQFYSYNDLEYYVNHSNYDIVHCSNEPDVLSCVLLNSNKPIVQDTHDFLSIRDVPDINMLALEYIANTKCDGNLYASEECMEQAINRYGTNRKNAEYLYNLPSLAALPKKQLEKLSCQDGQIHCVYEGGVSPNPSHFRCFEDQWREVAEAGIHIHFYSQSDVSYCKRLESIHPYIHYEGDADIAELLTLMTKYDVGWHVFNEFPAYKLKLDTTTSNKQYEYLASGLPMAVSNHRRVKSMVEKYDVGAVIDWGEDIYSQIKSISAKRVEVDFIKKHKLTMEDQTEKLIAFYRRVIEGYKSSHGL